MARCILGKEIDLGRIKEFFEREGRDADFRFFKGRGHWVLLNKIVFRVFQNDDLRILSRKLHKQKLLVGGLGASVCTCTSESLLKVKV